MKFISREGATPYHFAINIYSNQEQEALLWLKKRVAILMDGRNEIQNFESWDAKARKNLRHNSNEEFNSKSLLEISEIGLATISIEETYRKLNNETGLYIYSGSFDEFCAIGDENGLIICVDQINKRWFCRMV